MGVSDVIVFRGIKFRRYPLSKHRSDRVYYTPGQGDREKGFGRLHEEIWKASNGAIPNGCHIHHKDENPLNNLLDNLECLTPVEHSAKHADDAWRNSPEQLEHLAKIRPLASEWHRSDEGRAWHVEHGKRVYAKIRLEPHRYQKSGVCDQCSAEFTSVLPDRFWQNKCKSAWRRAAGLDDETRVCHHCGSAFVINKYRKTIHCTRSCARQCRKTPRGTCPELKAATA